VRRRLQQRFDPRSNARGLVGSQKIIHPARRKSMQWLLPALERWEEALAQMSPDNRPPLLIHMGIAISMRPPKLQEHLQDVGGRIQNYQHLRAEIIRKVDIAQVNRSTSRTEKKYDDPMEVGGLDKSLPTMLTSSDRRRVALGWLS